MNASTVLPPALERILQDLNPEQQAAVRHRGGPQLIVAGAGTGKTAVITGRIAYLVSAKSCTAREILALTFTDKAAAEMETRVDQLVPYGFTDSTICTFHAFGERLLREQGLLLGINPDYRLLNQPEQMIFLKEHLFDLPLKHFLPLSDPTRHLELILQVISRAKDEDVSPETYLALTRARLAGELADPAERLHWEKQHEAATLYGLIQRQMTAAGFLDFGDLMTLSLRLLREHPDVLGGLRARYRHILVDEFQDTNAAQFELLKLLAGPDAELTAVGDDDQSIYKFRGAAISNILQFSQIYPQAPIRVLNRNYRSTQSILDASHRLIAHNDPERLEVKHGLNKRLRSQRGEGVPVVYHCFESVSAEADWVAEDIFRRCSCAGRNPGDFAVLVRANRQADPFLRALNVRRLPYRFSGSQGLYQSPEVRLAMAFLQAVSDAKDDLAWYALATADFYAIPAEDLSRLTTAAKRRHGSLPGLMKAAAAGELDEISGPGREGLTRMVSHLTAYQADVHRTSAGQLLYRYLSESGVLAAYTQSDTPAGDQAIRNLAKFFERVKRYEGLARSDRAPYFIQHLEMLRNAGEDPAMAQTDEDLPAVSVLTLHRAKGLEFPVVYMTNLAANRFPGIQRKPALSLPDDLTKETLSGEDPFLPEERRLAYVGMTRAREELIFTLSKDYGGSRTYKISRFVLEALELPPAAIRTSRTSGLEQIRCHAPLPPEEGRVLTPLRPDEPLELSHNQVDDYLKCPLKFKYVHLLHIPVLPHHAISYGNALHAAVQSYYRWKMLRGTRLSEEELLEILKNAWVSEGFISREHEDLRWQAGVTAIRHFLARETALPSLPAYIEKPFRYTLGHNHVIGRMDRVDLLPEGGAVIIDFKSTEVADEAEADRRAKENLQLKIYAAAWSRLEGRLPVRLELHFLESDLIGRTSPTPEDIERTESLIGEVASAIRTRDFQPKPSAWTCNFCPFRSICPHACS